MQVTYTLQPSDAKAFNRHWRRHSPSMKRLRVTMWLLFIGLSIVGAVASYPDLSEHHAARVLYFLMLLALLVSFNAIGAWLLQTIVEYKSFRPSKNPGVICEHTIELTPEVLIERTAVNEQRIVWSSIVDITETPRLLLLFTGPNAAHIIPKRIFASPSAAAQFLAVARKYHAEGKKQLAAGVTTS